MRGTGPGGTPITYLLPLRQCWGTAGFNKHVRQLHRAINPSDGTCLVAQGIFSPLH